MELTNSTTIVPNKRKLNFKMPNLGFAPVKAQLKQINKITVRSLCIKKQQQTNHKKPTPKQKKQKQPQNKR